MGTLEGYAVVENALPQEAADVVLGMRGMIVGGRDLEARLLDRVLKVPNNIVRGQARGEDDIWICEG